jgi:hypothetical protein
MSYTRRSFLLGAASGASLLVLSACADDAPAPKPTPTKVAPTDTLPLESAFYRSNWAADPHARGATSYLPVGGQAQSREALREPLGERIFLAGEALSDDPGTVRGAMQSGRFAATLVADRVGADERVAVVGAGAAGAAAAQALSALGIHVVVVEARDRTGGRIDSRLDENGYALELGAWRVSPTDDTGIVGALSLEGTEVAPLEPRLALTPTDVVDAEPALTDSVTAASTWALDQDLDTALAEALRTVADEPMLDSALLSVAATTGADVEELSGWFTHSAVPSDSAVPTGPLSGIVDTMLEGVDTYLSTVVVGLSYDDGGVSMRLGTGESLNVDRVILTAPLGVLQQKLIEIDPPLPVTHRAALADLEVGHLEVLRLEFDEPFWSTEATWWVLEGEQPVRLWVNLLPATGRPVLLGIVGGPAAAALSELDDAAVRAAARLSLAPFAQPGI